MNGYEKLNGQKMPESLSEGVRFAFIQKDTATLLASSRKFSQHGQSGMWFSDLVPHIADCADDICMINSMHTDQFNHHPGQLNDAMWPSTVWLASDGLLALLWTGD